MANQIVVSAGAKVRNLQDVIIGTSGVLTSLGFDVANGVPRLDVNGKILVSQLPNSVMEYKGVWNAATNTPTLVNGTGNQGDVYLCNVAGTVDFGAGPIAFVVGDQVIYSGSIWQRASGATGTVTSVAITESGDSLNITGSPITTSGTINIGFNGTNLQYVNGAGNLTTFPILTGYVPYTGATANVDLGTFNLTADVITGATGSFASNGGSDTFAINHSSGAGIALNITKGGNGEGLYINKTSGSGNAATIIGTLNATTLVKSGGTSSQFLKANGTVDSSTYALDSAVVHNTGNETVGGTKTFSDATKNNGGIFLQNASSNSLAGYMNLGGLTNGVKFTSGGGVSNTFTLPSATGYTFTFPNATGTIALTSDLGAYLPLTGGTLTGNLGFAQPVGLLYANGQYIKDNGSGGLFIHSAAAINITSTSLTNNSNTILDSSNYNSYALPLTGGTLTGALNINVSSGTAMNVAGNAIFRGDTGVGTPRQLIITSGGSTPVYLEAKGYGANYQTDFGIRTYNNVGTAFEVFYADSSGRVGINRVAPSYQLDVNGTGRFEGALRVNGGTTTIYDFSEARLNFNTDVDGEQNSSWLYSDSNATLGSIGNVYIQALSTTVLSVLDFNNYGNNTANGVTGNVFIGTSVTQGIDKGAVLSLGGWTTSTGSASAFGRIAGRKENATSGNQAGYLSFETANALVSQSTEKARITSTGNFGLGVTPSAWATSNDVRAIQLKGGSLWSYSDFSLYLGSNYYWDGSVRKYIITYNASEYQQVDGSHIWFSAPSGTAGTTATFTERMRITSGGNVLIGTTTIAGYKVDIRSATGDADINIQPTIGTNAATLYLNNTGGGTYFGRENSAGGGLLAGSTPYATIMRSTGTNPIQFGVNNSVNFTIVNGGNVGIGKTASITGLDVYQSSADVINARTDSAAGNARSLYTGWNSASATTSGNLAFNVTSNGNVTNSNNSYGSLSDIKLKENIVDASDKLEDLLKVRIVNYNLIGQESKQIGVIAQELEQVFPSMIEEYFDKDENGGNLETMSKGVKYSVFVPMLIKAIQEQQKQIEELKLKIK
jgi:hypothetical protein